MSLKEEKSNTIFIENYTLSLSLLPISKYMYIFVYLTINICIFILLGVLNKSLTVPMKLLFEFLKLIIKKSSKYSTGLYTYFSTKVNSICPLITDLHYVRFEFILCVQQLPLCSIRRCSRAQSQRATAWNTLPMRRDCSNWKASRGKGSQCVVYLSGHCGNCLGLWRRKVVQ